MEFMIFEVTFVHIFYYSGVFKYICLNVDLFPYERISTFEVCILLLIFVLFLLAIVLSVLRFTDSDYPFGIFKLFLICVTSI